MNFRNLMGNDDASIAPIGNVTTNGYQMLYPHWHPHYEVMMIYSRCGYVLSNNSKTIVSDRPAVYVHRPYTVHIMRTVDDSVYTRSIVRVDNKIITGFPRDLADFSTLMAADLTCVYPDLSEMAELRELSEKIGAAAYRVRDKATTRLYIALLLRRLTMICESGRCESFSGGMTYIQDVMRLLAENLSESPTIKELTKRFGVGQTKFMADFKLHTGSTYKKYLTDLRMTRACELLTSGSSIIDVSLETGYSSEAHFIAAFRRYWGKTPGSFAPVKK